MEHDGTARVTYSAKTLPNRPPNRRLPAAVPREKHPTLQAKAVLAASGEIVARIVSIGARPLERADRLRPMRLGNGIGGQFRGVVVHCSGHQILSRVEHLVDG